MSSLKQDLTTQVILTDGAMGTYYNQLYPEAEELVENENLNNKSRIYDIHKAYIQAGARLLRTNTFASNFNFYPDRDELKANLQAGLQIARDAVANVACDGQVYVAADIGTLYDIGKDFTEVINDYKYIIDCFLEAGGDIFWFETQNDIFYIKELAQYIKTKRQDAYVIASFCVDKTGYSKSGISYKRIINEMCHLDSVDAYGFNCSMAGSQMVKLLENISFPSDKPLVTLPNAGYPYEVRGQIYYGKNIGYFVENEIALQKIGANIVGGCCGTTPEYISQISLENHIYTKSITKKKTEVVARTESGFWKKLQNGEKPFVVELDPPADMNYQRVVEGAKMLQEHNVDLLTLSDSPLARTRMDASLLGSKIQKEIGIDVMPHISCRDRNIISLRGTIMGAYANDLKHFLFVTGDPISKQNRADQTQVFNCNSIRLMNLADGMNHEEFVDDTIVYGGALNYNGVNVDAIARRMNMKMEQGCTFFLTQPIYSDDDVARIKELREMTGAKIMAGIMPLVSRKNAMFIADEMPGMNVPDYIVDKYKADMSREESEQVAIEISVEIAKKLQDCCDGYYFMTPFNRVNLICNVIEKIRSGLNL